MLLFWLTSEFEKDKRAKLGKSLFCPGSSARHIMKFQDSLVKIRTTFKRELRTYRLLAKDERTPRTAKVLLGLAVGYAVLPFDLIPDFIPVIGHLDDAIIVPSLVVLALRRIPKEVIEECRDKAQVVEKEGAASG